MIYEISDNPRPTKSAMSESDLAEHMERVRLAILDEKRAADECERRNVELAGMANPHWLCPL
ncbi:hypothetical protein AWB64_00467 [Caballeronia sordidicola]|uniref:Uncharacterized protein n=1 Tax=Caballeronia sordidicola TaxID=196367 RepID=A0A158EWX2_CABSO|nr:hypothetical protein [Caballeronia sordidicola]SAL12028.1 hypothetical protein AWB64_00467 [Caballeronia sordidicola]